MSVLVYAENWEGQFKKATFEAVSFGYDAAQKLDKSLITVVTGKVEEDELRKLGTYGAGKIIHLESEALQPYSTVTHANALEHVVEKTGAQTLIFPSTFNGKSLAPRLAAKLNSGIIAGAVSGIDPGDGIKVTKSVFSGKGFVNVKFNSDKQVLTITTNSFGVEENPQDPEIERISDDFGKENDPVKVLDQEKITGKIPLTEAELVVSGGRGMKGPENWNILEELAGTLNAGLACSKPVADMEWRPHSEHVGQTGLTIRPNLYLATGISGAIQHQAGVNSSKIIAVINKDPEAPFFKIADYGIVGDLFEVVPKITEAAKKLKSSD